MNEIIPSNALQKGSVIYVNDVPAKIERAEITFEPVFVKYFDKSLKERQAQTGLTITGKLDVRINPRDAKGKSFGLIVVVRIGSAVAEFLNECAGFSFEMFFMSLVAEQTQFLIPADHSVDSDQPALVPERHLPDAGDDADDYDYEYQYADY